MRDDEERKGNTRAWSTKCDAVGEGGHTCIVNKQDEYAVNVRIKTSDSGGRG